MTKTSEQIIRALADIRAAQEKVWADLAPLQAKSKALADKQNELIEAKWKLPEFAEQDFTHDLVALQELNRDAFAHGEASRVQRAWTDGFDPHIRSNTYSPDLDVPVPEIRFEFQEKVSNETIAALRKIVQAVSAGRTEVAVGIMEDSLSREGIYTLFVSGEKWNRGRIELRRYYHDSAVLAETSLREALEYIALRVSYGGKNSSGAEDWDDE